MSPSILIIDDETKMGKALKHVLDREGYAITAVDDPQGGQSPNWKKNPFDVLLCDLKMPTMSGIDVLDRAKQLQPNINVIMMTAYASAETAVESMKRGAYDYLIKPFAMDELKILIKRCLETHALQSENAQLKDQLREKFRPDNFICGSKLMQSVLARAEKIAASHATVLITGESGTGKEVLARIIHDTSPRKNTGFWAINCGAIRNLCWKANCLGTSAAPFTGAVEDRAGLFESAHKGSVFLDEIGEISPAMQVKLLRVLQSGEFQRVGDSATIKVDVRVIAATNRDLEKMVREKHVPHRFVLSSECGTAVFAAVARAVGGYSGVAGIFPEAVRRRQTVQVQRRGLGTVTGLLLAGQRARVGKCGGACGGVVRGQSAGRRRSAGYAAEFWRDRRGQDR